MMWPRTRLVWYLYLTISKMWLCILSGFNELRSNWHKINRRSWNLRQVGDLTAMRGAWFTMRKFLTQNHYKPHSTSHTTLWLTNSSERPNSVHASCIPGISAGAAKACLELASTMEHVLHRCSFKLLSLACHLSCTYDNQASSQHIFVEEKHWNKQNHTKLQGLQGPKNRIESVGSA